MSSSFISEGVGSNCVNLNNPVLVSLLEYFDSREMRARYTAFFVSWAHVSFDTSGEGEFPSEAMSMFRSYEEMFASEIEKFVELRNHDFKQEEVVEVLWRYHTTSHTNTAPPNGGEDEKDEAGEEKGEDEEVEEAKQVVTLLLASLD
eukprot:CAMPEP_0182477730 /NCGR_PEP_ID=MMETSP1319-20130603/31346_1 /TAXON_ID=172717 /ORGANISM="Bolidomonas pacifica, Strain RCC208" /LENGTH=146 /DNA_ID=CAMNT_0024678991 /DNA_START=141 /DNA_END=578 /DNA_ORIENTATION=-